MMNYEKPIVLANEDLAEGVYAASGASDDLTVTESTEPSIEPNDTGSDEAANNEIKCDSKYMKGVWQAPDYSSWNGGTRGYKQQFACLGCPANTANGCGLQTHYEDSGKADSYNVDNGNRMPSWERKGYGPDDVVTDWAM